MLNVNVKVTLAISSLQLEGQTMTERFLREPYCVY